jgi:ABC-type multidrug transport system fused ATPase/permease subunit
MKGYFMKKCIAILFFVALAVVVFGLVVMGLWNWLIPALFSGPQISFAEALGILVLSKILFGGFSGGWKRHHHCCNHNPYSWKMKWKEKMAARMSTMTPEEREKFKQKMQRCGWSDEKLEQP